MTSVVLYSLTRATLTSPGKDETRTYIERERENEREKERQRKREKERETERQRDTLSRLEFDNEEWLCRTNTPTYVFVAYPTYPSSN